jgi:hypothetical protein
MEVAAFRAATPDAATRITSKHWGEGGETSLENTILLCRFHHRLLHEEAFQLKRLPGAEVEFRNPHGLLVPRAPTPPRQPNDPFRALLARLEDGAIVVDSYTGTPTWDGSRPDLGLAVEWFLDQTRDETTKSQEDGASRGASPVIEVEVPSGGAPTVAAAPMAARPRWRDPWLAAVRADDGFDDED